MFLSVRHRILFVHIAKTGGTSIRTALSRLRWTDPYSIPIYMGNHLGRATKYRTACKLPRHAKAVTAQDMLGRRFFGELFKFSMVRNPWDLHVSSWLHLRRKGHAAGQLDFADFLDTRFDPDRPPDHGLDTLKDPQVRHLTDFDGNLLVDFVGRFERIEQDFHEACRRGRIPLLSLPHRRKATARDDYRTYYTDRLAQMIASKHRADVDRFGYTFDPEPTAVAP